MEVNIGQEELIFESGSFTHFGIQTLNQVISSPSSPGLFLSLPSNVNRQIYLSDLPVILWLDIFTEFTCNFHGKTFDLTFFVVKIFLFVKIMPNFWQCRIQRQFTKPNIFHETH